MLPECRLSQRSCGVIDREQHCAILFRHAKGGLTMKQVLIAALVLAGCGQSAKDVGAVDLTKKAQEFVDLLVQADYGGVVDRFDSKMRETLPQEQVEGMWMAMQEKFGRFRKQIGVRQTKEQGFDCVYVTCSFEKRNVDIKIVFNERQRVAGLWFN